MVSYSFHVANSYLKIVVQGWNNVFAGFEMMAFDATEQVNLYCNQCRKRVYRHGGVQLSFVLSYY